MQPDGIDLEYIYIHGLSRPQSPLHHHSSNKQRLNHRPLSASHGSELRAAWPAAGLLPPPADRRTTGRPQSAVHVGRCAPAWDDSPIGREIVHAGLRAPAWDDSLIGRDASHLIARARAAGGVPQRQSSRPRQKGAAAVPLQSHPLPWGELWDLQHTRPAPLCNDAPGLRERLPGASSVYGPQLSQLLSQANKCSAAVGSKYRYVATGARPQTSGSGSSRDATIGAAAAVVERRLVTVRAAFSAC